MECVQVRLANLGTPNGSEGGRCNGCEGGDDGSDEDCSKSERGGDRCVEGTSM